MRLQTAGLFLALAVATAQADVHFSGLYHNNTNLNPQTEAVPSFPTNTFLELQYDRSNVVFHFLTQSPAGNPDESVEASVRIFSTHTETPGAFFQANVVLSETNLFHGAVTNGTATLDLWRVDWTPPHGFAGAVFYAPRILVRDTNGVQTDQQYLLATIGTNTGPQWGDNSAFYPENPQAIGDNPFDHDYSFAWTNAAPLNYDMIYFNNTNAALPENEEVPGLGGIKFFQFNTASNEQSYIHTIVPQGAINGYSVRAFLTDGPGLFTFGGTFLTNVVLTPTNQFHGLPTSGAVTMDVWRAGFYPPSGWIGTIFYAPQIFTALDGSPYLVRNDGLYTNNWLTDPQQFHTDPVARDWSFTVASPIVRTSLQRDFLYHNNTNLNPQQEFIPDTDGLRFLQVDYSKTTTTFYVITDSPLNLVPGEGLSLEIRTSYTTNGVDYVDQYTPMVFDRNILLSPNSFHGATTSGTRQVDLWRAEWPQPTANGQAITNAITVYYAPLLKTSSGTHQTDYTWLLTRIVAGGPGYGTNNYPVYPQLFGADPFSQDYFYVNQFTVLDADGDGMADAWEMTHFGTTTNAAGGDVDEDEWTNLDEYIADTQPTNPASFFGTITNAALAADVLTLVVNPSSTERLYDAYVTTDLLQQAWSAYGLAVQGNGGVLTLFVTNNAPTRNYRSGVRLP